ncbi:hypothetical protein NP233_g1958 [Leucocoprinus birnbaumii]|uniref:Uncharacterized protein n=1 Tax=Leucocoprinus birnbaumii TaxID=56174 RepID=A0AAD5YZ58_9AGAR|nr:hypothetical protein NP233_g1958 [Leucocoprinus birnbaumii]
MATGGYNLCSHKSALVAPASEGIGGNTAGDVAAPADPAQNVEPVVNHVAGVDFYSPSPLTPSPPGSWEQVPSRTRVLPSSVQRSDLSASSPASSELRSQNRFEVLASIPDHRTVGDTIPADESYVVDDHIIFAINPLDEPNEQLSPEQLDAVNQAAANLSDEQRDDYRHRHPETPGNAQAGTSRDKGKGTDPRNWGAAGIPDQELDADTQRVLLENIRFVQHEPVAHPKKHKKRSKAKEREHHKKSKANKKAKTREELNEAHEASVHSNTSTGVTNHIRRIANASKGNTASRLNNLRRIDDNLRPSKQINPHSYLGKALADA